jgi:general secretion pathway protein D
MEAALADRRPPDRAGRLPGARRRAAFAFPVLLALTCLSALLIACASTSALHKGRDAERVEDYDRAVAEYTSAVRLKPDSQDARLGLQRSKLRASEYHFNRGRRFSAAGKLDAALVEYQVAAELNPASGDIDKALRETRSQAKAKVAVAREGKTGLETLIERTRDVPPPGLDLPKALKLPASLVFRDASSRDVFTAMGRFADVNVLFDPAFRDVAITIDLRNSTFEDGLNAVCGTTRNFYRVTAPKAVTIVPDTPAKRREYEEEIVRTFYLGNADLKETIDLLRMVIDLRRLNAITAINAISVKDTPERIQAAGRLIAAIDKARPEVVIDVELLEVNRTHLLEYGLQPASPGSSGIDGAVDVNKTGLTLQDLRNLTQSGVFLSGLPALYYRLLKSDASTRTLANPQLRTSEGIPATAKFGERVPVPVTTFSPIATGGVAQQPITSFNYENIGVNIDLTPRTHHNDDVSLTLKLEVSSISGTGFGGLPTFGNRAVTTVIRLKDGETSILGGLIRDDERTTLDGIPGLSDIPVVGRLFAKNHRERQQTDIILTLTPHIVRVLDLTEADLRPFRVGRDAGTSFIELPPAETPPRDIQKPPIPPIKAPDPIKDHRPRTQD